MNSSTYDIYTKTICFENFKDAALYFDRVLPLNMGRSRGNGSGDILVGYPEEIPSRVLAHLLDGIEVEDKSWSHADRVFDEMTDIWVDFARSVMPYAYPFMRSHDETEEIDVVKEYRKLLDAYLSDLKIDGHKPIRQLFQEYAYKVGFDKFSVIMFNNQLNSDYSSDPSLTLSKLNLIDTSKADWKQILEVRKDKISHQQLAKLRVFISKNYANCSFSYIEDDISSKLYDYELVCKKFGFETTASTISTLLDSRSLQTSIGAGLIAGLFGGPIVGLSAGAAIEVGKIAIQFAEKKHAMKYWQQGHELAYIFETNKTLSK